MLNKETQMLINSARKLGGEVSISLTDGELLHICAVIAVDFGKNSLVSDTAELQSLAYGYYRTPFEWFKQPTGTINFEERFMQLESAVPDFATCFKLLCEIHKRRLKYETILSRQALSNIEVIAPRALLEMGLHTDEVLASWLVWKKWFFDIDNRSGQETGYLFEPILTASLGGVPYSARKSPIKRKGDKSKGRQVDCITGEFAYEFKMRMTRAASGQGRFNEELAFAEDCHSSQPRYIPILLVLDATPSPRLTELSKEYKKFGGQAFVGNDAWEHLYQKAGATMAQFIEKYVREPINEVTNAHVSLTPIHMAATDLSIEVQIGSRRFSIVRSQTNLLDANSDRDEDEEADDNDNS